MSASRRDFLRWSALAGAGLVIHFPLLAQKKAGGAPVPFVPNQWLRVGTDGGVTLIVPIRDGAGSPHLPGDDPGRGARGDWSSVSIEQASPTPLYEDMNTGGSDSVESSWLPLRRAAASARLMLVQAAAKVCMGVGQSCIGVFGLRASLGLPWPGGGPR